MIKPTEIPLRLSWLNVNFKGLTEEASKLAQISSVGMNFLYQKARALAEEPVKKIIDDANREFKNNIQSLLIFKSHYAEYKPIPVKKLCFDASHEFYGIFRGVPIKRGELLTDFYKKNQDNPEIKKSVNFINNHLEFFNTHIPVVVKEFGDKFEVLSGNHRVFTAVKNKLISIPVLVITKKKPEKCVESLDFKTSP